MSVLGIDLSAAKKGTYGCTLDAVDGCLVAEIHPGCDDATLRALARGRRKVSVDAPFGWPDAFVDALVAHRDGAAWPAPDDGDPALFRAALSYRETDRVVMHTKRPLSVSTDKLGVTAMRCAHLLHRWSEESSVDRSGNGRFVEVYPAAALARFGVGVPGYRGDLGAAVARLEAALPLRFVNGGRDECVRVHDAFDALVAALVARAAHLGLTDGPPKDRLEQARREGWIHLPVRGSLSFLARERDALGAAPQAALAARLRQAGRDVDDDGYVERFDDILLDGLTPQTRDAIRRDLTGKGGSELVPKAGKSPKFHAAHSSAALAANTFGPFLCRSDPLPLGELDYTGSVHLERRCPTSLDGTPPTLDCVVEGEAVLAVESKCTEPFARKAAKFSGAYGPLMAAAHRSWREEFRRLCEDSSRYRFLDAAQLVKHYLGLRTTFAGQRITLLYLYWEPANADDLLPCAVHRAEMAAFAAHVNDPAIVFAARSYAQLWNDWSEPRRPGWLREHAAALRERYLVDA